MAREEGRTPLLTVVLLYIADADIMAECYGWKDLLNFAGSAGNFQPVSGAQRP